jgi:transposase-like protein
MARKYRTFSADFKLDTVLEGFRGEKSIAQICREREINDVLYYKWRDTFLEKAANVFGGQGDNNQQKLEARIAELERMIGRLTLENEILKKAKSLLDSGDRKNGL